MLATTCVLWSRDRFVGGGYVCDRLRRCCWVFSSDSARSDYAFGGCTLVKSVSPLQPVAGVVVVAAGGADFTAVEFIRTGLLVFICRGGRADAVVGGAYDALATAVSVCGQSSMFIVSLFVVSSVVFGFECECAVTVGEFFGDSFCLGASGTTNIASADGVGV